MLYLRCSPKVFPIIARNTKYVFTAGRCSDFSKSLLGGRNEQKMYINGWCQIASALQELVRHRYVSKMITIASQDGKSHEKNIWAKALKDAAPLTFS